MMNKTIWITGASSGIGRALAINLAKQKSRLIISGTNKEKLDELRNECLKNTDFCMVKAFDISDIQKIELQVEEVIEKTKKIDILINNAGKSQRSTAISTNYKVDKKLMDINYFGTVALTKAVLPHMIKNNQGHIAVTSSAFGKFGFPFRSGYAASKHALEGFFESVRFEIKQYNIGITIVNPGFINTDISKNALNATGNPHNKTDKIQTKGMSAQRCAELYIRAINKKKKTSLIGGRELLMFFFKKYMPAIFRKIGFQFLKK